MNTSTTSIHCYLDCFSGISGDMLLGALLHAGADKSALLSELNKLNLEGLDLQVESTRISSIDAFKVTIDSSRQQQFRNLPKILEILVRSALDETIINRSTEVFTALAEAEAKVHGIDINRVHFHEVGALDTIVDIVGVIICLKHLGVSRLTCSPLPTGQGFVNCDHGLLPLPAPAVCELLQGLPSYGVDIKQELITPTGAALLRVLADDFGPLPPMTFQSTGYGAGSRTLENGQPNLLRCIIGKSEDVVESQQIEIIETNLDDWSPEGFPYLTDLLFERGALDVTLTPVQMKKGRPGYTLQVLTTPPYSQRIKETIFDETTAIGLRFRQEHRSTLVRNKIVVPTPWGDIPAKEVQRPDGSVIYPEYEECKKIAVANGVPLKMVYQKVLTYRK